jgi:hypothetical protein
MSSLSVGIILAPFMQIAIHNHHDLLVPFHCNCEGAQIEANATEQARIKTYIVNLERNPAYKRACY